MSGASSDFSRLNPRAPLAQPEVRHVGPGWSDPTMRVDWTDAQGHGALNVLAPGELPPAAESPPASKPPVLSEAERRAQLAAAIAAKAEAKTALDAAAERHERVIADEARCRDVLASFAALPAEIARHKELALRNGADACLPETLRSRLQEHSAAELDLAAAQQAVPIFGLSGRPPAPSPPLGCLPRLRRRAPVPAGTLACATPLPLPTGRRRVHRQPRRSTSNTGRIT